MSKPLLLLLLTVLPATTLSAQQGATHPTVHPKIRQILDGVSEERIAATLKKLESFGTRNTFSSQTDPVRGIGAARRWILDEMKSYSPRLEVRFDSYKLKRQAGVAVDAELHNVVAVLPGTVSKDREVMITAHYDSLVLRRRPGQGQEGQQARPAASAPSRNGARTGGPPPPADPNIDAPGVTDNGSGTSAVMELARLMSQHEFEKTLVFVLFSGEEQGLIGASLYSATSRKDGRRIEAVLNNDIIGSTVGGDGTVNNSAVRVFSGDPADSPSRQLARFVRDVADRYMPMMRVDTIFRSDRWGRGGDHTPFHEDGFAAVRFTAAIENYSHQHTPTDTFENTSVAYIAKVARINGAAAATLALAPRSPEVMEPRGRRNSGQEPSDAEPEAAGANRGPAMVPMLSRGTSRYDAQLRWKNASPEADLAGYVVVMRSTKAPDWERHFPVGSATEFTLPGVSIDEWLFGVKAVDREGNESLVAPFVMPRRVIRQYEFERP